MIRSILEKKRIGRFLNKISETWFFEKVLENYFSQTSEWVLFEKKIRDTSYETQKGDILLPVDGVTRSTIRSLILARKLEMNGYNPILVNHYELKYPSYIYPKIGKVSFKEALIKKRKIKDQVLADKLGYEIINIEGSKKEKTLRNYDIKKNALACTKKHFRRYNIDLSQEEVKSAYSKYIKTSHTILRNLERINNNRDIQAIITHDPAYLNGIYGEFGVKNNINSYSISWAWNQQKTLLGNFKNRNPLGQFTNRDVLEAIMAEKASEEEIHAGEKVIEDRSNGKNLRSNHKEFSSENTEIDFSEKATIYSLFTNLLWDASLEADDVAFESPFSWLERTIEFFKDNKSKKLIIKTHPAEEKRITDEKVFEWLQENYNFDQVDNIKILPPKTDIDPYDLMRSTDVGIVYNSTTGMEMSSQGIPVIVVGDTHYRDLGFTIEPSNTEEYLEELSKNTSNLEKNSRKAKQYINFLFNRKQIDFQYIKENGTEFNKIRDEDIRNDESLDLIIEKILNGKEVFYED